MAFVIDVFARQIVGGRVSAQAGTDFVLAALGHAIHAGLPQLGGALVGQVLPSGACSIPVPASIDHTSYLSMTVILPIHVIFITMGYMF